jgi:hypothetical protein
MKLNITNASDIKHDAHLGHDNFFFNYTSIECTNASPVGPHESCSDIHPATY